MSERNATNGRCLIAAGFLFWSSVAGAANNPNVYLAMGDGITSGSFPTVGDPWPPRLDNLLGTGKTVVNEGKAASRVGYGVSRVDGYLARYLPGYLLILYGTNDIGIGNDVDYIINQLRYMILAAKSNNTVPVIGTLPPILNGYGSGQATVNSRIRQLAIEQNIQCADVSAAFNYQGSLLLSDGLHPTPQGQQLIAQTFLNAIAASVPPVVTSVAQVTVPEGETATFGVKLGNTPANATTVTVSRASGDSDIRVADGTNLIFTTANYGSYQQVTLAADHDADTRHGSATIQCAASGFNAVRVTATEQDSEAPPFANTINCGGPALFDAAGYWYADMGFEGGSLWDTTSTVDNATNAPMALYQTERSSGTFRYNLPAVPDGTYRVKLHFSEMSASAAGQRIFDVAIEGARVITNLDVFVAAGGRRRALVRSFDVAVSDGNGLQIDFTAVVNTAEINGIEIDPLGPPAPALVTSVAQVTVPEGGAAAFGAKLNVAPANTTTVSVIRASGDSDIRVVGGGTLVFTPANYGSYQDVTLAAGEDADTANGHATIQCTAPGFASTMVAATEQDNDSPPYASKINSGGPALTDGWLADAGFEGGAVWSTASTVDNATEAPMALYQTERSAASFRYNLPAVPDGMCRVKLHFSEMSATAAGQRIFDVAIEGARVITNLDVFVAAGGGRRALTRTFDVTVSDGNGLQVDFTAVVNTAEINGIEIESVVPPMVTGIAQSAGNGVVLEWQGISNRTYTICRSTNLVEGFVPIASNIEAAYPINVYTDKVGTLNAAFYDIRLEP